eukprot:scaffold101_cov230-Pinguiococcus_pyrenoidosus.AAC.12
MSTAAQEACKGMGGREELVRSPAAMASTFRATFLFARTDEQIPDDHENRPVTERGDPLQADRYARCQHSNHLRHHHEVADRIDVRDGVDTRPAEERIIQSNVGVGEVELFLGLRRFSPDPGGKGTTSA